MHRRPHINAVGFRRKPVRQEGVNRRVQEDGNGAENDHRGDGDRHFAGFRFDDRFGRQYRCRAADAAAGANQPAGMFIQAENLLPKKAGDKKGAGKRQHVNDDTAYADVGNLGERQAKAV